MHVRRPLLHVGLALALALGVVLFGASCAASGTEANKQPNAADTGTTIVVAKSGGAYSTIQAGLNAAKPGDTVDVKAGTYNERVTFPGPGAPASTSPCGASRGRSSTAPGCSAGWPGSAGLCMSTTDPL